MNPREALDLLDRVGGMVSLNRADHVKIQEAVVTLRQLIDSISLATAKPDQKDAQKSIPVKPHGKK